MEVSQEVIRHSTDKSVKSVPKETPDKVYDVFWDAHWTLDDDDQQYDSALVLL
jgi:hypothetical protein